VAPVRAVLRSHGGDTRHAAGAPVSGLEPEEVLVRGELGAAVERVVGVVISHEVDNNVELGQRGPRGGLGLAVGDYRFWIGCGREEEKRKRRRKKKKKKKKEKEEEKVVCVEHYLHGGLMLPPRLWLGDT